MYTTGLLSAALLVTSALATKHEMMSAAASPANMPMMTPAAAAAAGQEVVHVVQVGMGGKLEFSPNNVQAEIGDLVQFQFWPKVTLFQPKLSDVY
jgi:plastocyanin